MVQTDQILLLDQYHQLAVAVVPAAKDQLDLQAVRAVVLITQLPAVQELLGKVMQVAREQVAERGVEVAEVLAQQVHQDRAPLVVRVVRDLHIQHSSVLLT
jgi:hypothetical protein